VLLEPRHADMPCNPIRTLESTAPDTNFVDRIPESPPQLQTNCRLLVKYPRPCSLAEVSGLLPSKSRALPRQQALRGVRRRSKRNVAVMTAAHGQPSCARLWRTDVQSWPCCKLLATAVVIVMDSSRVLWSGERWRTGRALSPWRTTSCIARRGFAQPLAAANSMGVVH